MDALWLYTTQWMSCESEIIEHAMNEIVEEQNADSFNTKY